MIELFLALIFEFIRGEPPSKLHPTVWFGRIIEVLDKKLPAGVLYGAIPPLAVVLTALALYGLTVIFPDPIKLLLTSYLLYTTFSIKSMIEHAKACISGDKIVSERLKMIVSRNVDELEEWEKCSAVIESVSENFVDGVLAPLFYYGLFGLPGALVYRAINTCDAMLGYRYGKYEKFGKVSAKLDDALNYTPSRLSLLFFFILNRNAFYCGLRMNPKLNGHSISAMAGLLRVKLRKPGSYTIDCGKKPDVEDIEKSIFYFKLLSGMAVISAVLLRLMV